MARWVRYHDRKTVAKVLRAYPPGVQEWAAGDDVELRALLGLDGEQKRLL